MKALKRIKTDWSANLAYAIGLLVTDGTLSIDGRHMELTSKDEEQLKNFLKCVDVDYKITLKHSGSGKEHKRVQFGDVNFYKFLLSVGLMPAKTKIIKAVEVPGRYFFDFLRGHFDGDGTFYSYWDPRWRSSYMFYTVLISASESHIDWLREEIYKRLKISGHITKSKNSCIYQLKYAKKDSLKLLHKMYYDGGVVCLSRKRQKVERALKIEDGKL